MKFKILFTFLSLCLAFLEISFSKLNLNFCDKKNDPVLIAHHIGLNDWPENTLFAVKQAKQAGLQWINITVMLSADDIPFLFHGFDLGKTTEEKGNPEDYTIDYLQTLNASYQFKKEGSYIYRDQQTEDFNIPTLKAVLSESGDLFVVVDIKTKRYKNLIDQLEGVLTPHDWKRVIFYSTDAKVLDYLLQKYPNAISFQKRDVTRGILLKHKTSSQGVAQYKSPHNANWHAFEDNRKMEICETFTLGKGCNIIEVENLWDRALVETMHQKIDNAKLVMIGVNNLETYEKARKIGVDAVYTDIPLEIIQHRGCIDKKTSLTLK